MEKHEFGNFEKFGKRLKMLSRALRNTLNPSFKDKQYRLETNSELTQTDRNISGSLMLGKSRWRDCSSWFVRRSKHCLRGMRIPINF